MKKTKIPYAVASYAKLIKEGYYFVDKTEYIGELEHYQVPVFLRPRRFGKSLMCSMLQHYYDINRKGEFAALFGDTWIGQHPTGLQNTRMVMSLNFSIVQVEDDLKGLERNFNNVMNAPIRGFVQTTYKAYFKEDFKFNNEANISDMLSDILEYIQVNNLPPLYLIVDEYDNFTNQLITAYNDSLYEEVTCGESFLRTFFKVIKAGIGSGAIASCYITGVLPITMDDLTSGFNIAEMVTLEPRLVSMLGFTYTETLQYLDTIWKAYDLPQELYAEVWQIIRANYDGYHFLQSSEPLFNSTILTYFLKRFTMNDGQIPDELIDENLRTDVNWIKRLTLGTENAKKMLDNLVIDGAMLYNRSDLKSRFNREQFFNESFYPISLYYLGMTTLKDGFYMELPNNTMRSIFVDYYNTLHELSRSADLYAPVFVQYLKDKSMETLFGGYYKTYLAQFPAQTFDKINENFVRNTFYELCVRYLSAEYTFSIEQNYPSGRCDWEMTGMPRTSFHGEKLVVEFKYLKAKEHKKIQALTGPDNEDVQQVTSYATDMLAKFPFLNIRKYVIYVAANKGYRIWEV